MRGKMPRKLLSLLLSGILIFTGTDVTVVQAAESEMQSAQQQEEEAGASTSSQDDADSVLVQTQPEGEAGETQEPTENGMVSSEPEDETKLPETPGTASEISTESQEEKDTVETETQTESECLTEAGTEEESETDVLEETMSQDGTEEERTTEVLIEEDVPLVETVFKLNPIYEGFFDADELGAQAGLYQDISPYAERGASEAFQTIQDAAVYLREQMLQRADAISFSLPAPVVTGSGSLEALADDLVNAATAYTEDCTGQEGDALLWGYKSYGMTASSDGVTFALEFRMTYHSTYEQEQQLTAEVKRVMEGMALAGKSEYEKVKAIHDYICDHVDYDDSLTKYSAYDALCTGKAVCQGYSVLFYRMCREAGLSVRIISGTGNGGRHGWNIVRIADNARAAGKYYNVDCTWDGQGSTTHHLYFLKCEADFVNHTRDSQYATDAFYQDYPMSDASYVTSVGMNVENLDEWLWVYDGDNDEDNDVSTTTRAEGKPKVLIFIQETCTRSKATVKSIASYDFGNADIYVVSTLYETSKFAGFIQETAPNSDHIVFAYNGSTAWNNYFDLAMEHAGWLGNEKTPTICFIDADNKLQYMTYGQQTANAIQANINHYCMGNGSGDVTAYTITYYLNGGENNTGNPSAYTSQSETIILKAPTREGHIFAGWYSDAAFKHPVTEIAKGSTGNKEFYAKWEEGTQEPSPSFPQIDMLLADGNILMGVSGEYVTETADAILNRLNAIRQEACREGVKNPVSGEPLTEADYKPLKWSSDLEAVAMLRAAEASVRLEHTRPNGTAWHTVRTTNKEQSWAENLAWNHSGLMQGIEQWYGEKADWVNGTDRVTGHYESIISTRYQYVAVSAFKMKEGAAYPVTVAQEFSDKSVLDSQKSELSGSYVQDMEIAGSAVTKLAFTDSSSVLLSPGSTYQLSVNATAGYQCANGTTLCTGPVRKGGVWRSSDESVARVDTEGNVTAVGSGTASISMAVGTVSVEMQVEVDGDAPVEPDTYTVTFDVQGHGTAPQDYTGIQYGTLIGKPADPVADGYEFIGWYRDAGCLEAWDFETDVVVEDITLYAKWVIRSSHEDGFYIQEIPDVSYTGKAIKPSVSVYDGSNLLKINKDYKLQYSNNVNANADGENKKGSGIGTDFVAKLPSVKIIGLGNYEGDTFQVNFNIVPAQLSDGSGNAAKGVVLNCNDQIVVNQKKDMNPFVSVKFGKNLVKGKDFTLSLTPVDGAKDAAGKELPKKEIEGAVIKSGYSGDFELAVAGCGNYSGTIRRTIHVRQDSQLMKNAKITLGKDIRSISFKDFKAQGSKLMPTYYDTDAKKYYPVKNGMVDRSTEVDSKRAFTVTCGGNSLVWEKDFIVRYENHDMVGKASLVIVGINDYAGEKSASFQITGLALKAGNVTVKGIEPKQYTGNHLVQESIQLTYQDKAANKLIPMSANKDYIVSYKNNVNKGTATITFTAVKGSLYSGSFSKTFKINAADIAVLKPQADRTAITVPYEKAGAKPADRLTLKNAEGTVLVNGRDYTVTFKNNKAVAGASDTKAPTMVVQGKGNYSGKFEKTFTITTGNLNSKNITIEIVPTAYNSKKQPAYEYKPAVKVKDGKSLLRTGKDYAVTYRNNSQEAYERYIDALKNNAGDAEALMPAAELRAVEGSNYVLKETMIIPLPIYQTKLAKNNLYVVIESQESITYSGKQLCPHVRVYYSDDKSKITAAQKKTSDVEIRALGLKPLQEARDYTLSYGTNIAAGKQKGSIVVQGKSPDFGGSVTVKFDIRKKKVAW